MQIAEDSVFGYNSPYWTNDVLLSENSSPLDNVNAKYAAFLNASFNTIRMCSGSVDTNCVSYTFNTTWDSARELFNSPFIRAADQNQDLILKVFGPKKGDYRVFYIFYANSSVLRLFTHTIYQFLFAFPSFIFIN